MYIFGRAGGSLYNTATPNRAHATLWPRNFNDANMLCHIEHFLATIPLTGGPVGFTELVFRAVDSTEMPLEEHDLRSTFNAGDASLETDRGVLLWLILTFIPKWSPRSGAPRELCRLCLSWRRVWMRSAGHFRSAPPR